MESAQMGKTRVDSYQEGIRFLKKIQMGLLVVVVLVLCSISTVRTNQDPVSLNWELYSNSGWMIQIFAGTKSGVGIISNRFRTYGGDMIEVDQWGIFIENGELHFIE